MSFANDNTFGLGPEMCRTGYHSRENPARPEAVFRPQAALPAVLRRCRGAKIATGARRSAPRGVDKIKQIGSACPWA